ncbi:MAG: hypothetical protein J7L32_01145 [Thermoplasmata archaeon]|nr:hypothetical protein [Thermoplasmata archaeon]
MVEEDANMPEYKSLDNVDAFKENLQQVTTQLEAIRTSFYQGVEEIEKIKKTLDAGHLNQFSNIISEFEGRLIKAERERDEAIESAKKYNEELEKEKERLIKLWDAYKLQEDELATKEKRITELENKIETYEQSMKQLEEDLNNRINTLTEKLTNTEATLKEYETYKNQHEKFEKIRADLEERVNQLENELNSRETELNNLKKEVAELRKYKKYANYKENYDKLSAEYEKERDRLTKLYKLYEEVENERDNLKTELERWHSWYDSNAEIFDRLFKSAEDLRKTVKKKKKIKKK